MKKKHSTMVGKSKIDNLIVTDDKMVTVAINKGNDLTNLIRNLEESRHDDRTTKTVRLWIKNGKVFVSNRFKAEHC